MTTVLQFFPDRLDVNGDAQNALVLTQRARWAGWDAEVVAIAPGDQLPSERPCAVVIGSSVDSELLGLRDDLAPFVAALRDWVSAGVPLLAVGTGFELLSHGIQLGTMDEPGQFIEGFGIFPGRAQPMAQRATGDLVVDAREGQLVGFENHARGFLVPTDAATLGPVVRGRGNDSHSEGSRVGSAIGTHLHGPVLAKNPVLADAILGSVLAGYSPESDRAQQVDAYAATARQAILTQLDVS